MKKKLKVIMLPTDKRIVEGDIISRTIDDKLAIVNCLTLEDKNSNKDGHKANHIYLVSDEGIKEGDWFINHYNSVTLATDKVLKDLYAPKHKKVIATTDKSLGIYITAQFAKTPVFKSLPQIPESFIKYFVEKNGKVDKVEVEWADDWSGGWTDDWTGGYDIP